MQRKSSIEVLRIISMLLIVMSHLCVHTPWDVVSSDKQYIINCLSLGEVGVIVFVLITGYFSFRSTFKCKNLLKICLQVQFYSLICYVFIRILGFEGDFDRFTLTPVLSGAYWFATVYVGLYLAIPFLNCVVRSFSCDGMRRFLILTGVVLSVIPLVIETPFIYSNFLYFVFLYLLGAYFGKYGNPLLKYTYTVRIIFACVCWLVLFATIALSTRYTVLGEYGINPSYLISLNSVVVLPVGVSLFLLIEPIDLGSIRVINVIASASFGVYLLSDNYLIRPILWSVMGMSAFTGADIGMLLFVLRGIVVVIAVYSVCVVVDLARIYLLEKPLFMALAQPIAWFDSRVNAFFDFEKESVN